MKTGALICCFICGYFVGWGQITPPSVVVDSTRTQDELISSSDTANVKEIKSYATRYVPRKASLYSAILPGLGQIYNKDYWKLPLVYGGLVSFALVVDFYNGQYREARAELFALLESDDPDGVSPRNLNQTQLRTIIDDTRRERDFYMVITGVFYLLQIAEAHISAHLKEFKLNPDLRVKIEPSFERPQFESYRAGLSVKLKF